MYVYVRSCTGSCCIQCVHGLAVGLTVTDMFCEMKFHSKCYCYFQDREESSVDHTRRGGWWSREEVCQWDGTFWHFLHLQFGSRTLKTLCWRVPGLLWHTTRNKVPGLWGSNRGAGYRWHPYLALEFCVCREQRWCHWEVISIYMNVYSKVGGCKDRLNIL